MPIANYGVLKCTATDHILATSNSQHYQVHVLANGADYRIAVNVLSLTQPPDLLYFLDNNFQHPITATLSDVGWGFTQLASTSGEPALDYLRANLFDITKMQSLPPEDPSHNDLNDLIDTYIQQAIAQQDTLLYAFGQSWGPENKPDQYFGFVPGQGVHDIHMNQGNAGSFVNDDGVWQDGGLLIHFQSPDHWVALFLAFQSQCFQTDDTTGHCA